MQNCSEISNPNFTLPLRETCLLFFFDFALDRLSNKGRAKETVDCRIRLELFDCSEKIGGLSFEVQLYEDRACLFVFYSRY